MTNPPSEVKCCNCKHKGFIDPIYDPICECPCHKESPVSEVKFDEVLVYERFDDGTVQVQPEKIVFYLMKFIGDAKLSEKTWKRIAQFNSELLGETSTEKESPVSQSEGWEVKLTESILAMFPKREEEAEIIVSIVSGILTDAEQKNTPPYIEYHLRGCCGGKLKDCRCFCHRDENTLSSTLSTLVKEMDGLSMDGINIYDTCVEHRFVGAECKECEGFNAGISAAIEVVNRLKGNK